MSTAYLITLKNPASGEFVTLDGYIAASMTEATLYAMAIFPNLQHRIELAKG